MEMLLDGKWVDRDPRAEVHDPQDGSLIDTVPLASADDMRAAIDAAVAGAAVARALPTHERMAILQPDQSDTNVGACRAFGGTGRVLNCNEGAAGGRALVDFVRSGTDQADLFLGVSFQRSTCFWAISFSCAASSARSSLTSFSSFSSSWTRVSFSARVLSAL